MANDIFDVELAAGLRGWRVAGAACAVVRAIVIKAAGPPFHIAVFCRPLIAGQVKTRLIAAYGPEGAARIYAQLVEQTLRTVVATGASASLWVAGNTAHTSVTDWARRYTLPIHSQCEGGLGERMSQCLAILAETHKRVLLIGTDCPAFTVENLQAAAAALNENCPWAFTPAEDGGYVLVGSNAASARPFANITWSTSEVMTQTRNALRTNALAWTETATLWDVDEAADVERARSLNLIDK